MEIFKQNYSINFDEFKRSPKGIVYVIFHYTGMVSEKKAIERLSNKSSMVSCHYYITSTGKIIQMVPDLYKAWHAGESSWAITNL